MNMTLKEIKAMFVPGDKWSVTRSGSPLTVVGNTATTVLPANNVVGEVRTIKSAKSQLVATKEDGRNVFTNWPKAGEIIAASAGNLSFKYDNGVIVTFVKI